MKKRGSVLIIVLVVAVVLVVAGYIYFGLSGDDEEERPAGDYVVPVPFDDSCLDAKELFATEDEALDHAEKLGCSGSHMHEGYVKPYMACRDHNQPIDEKIIC